MEVLHVTPTVSPCTQALRFQVTGIMPTKYRWPVELWCTWWFFPEASLVQIWRSLLYLVIRKRKMGWCLYLNLYPWNKLSQTCFFLTFQLWIGNLVQVFLWKKNGGLSPGLDWNPARRNQRRNGTWKLCATRKGIPVSVGVSGTPSYGTFPYSSHSISIRIPPQKSGDHQLRLVVYPIVYRVLYIPSWCSVSSISSMLNVYGIREYVGICPHPKIDECFTKKWWLGKCISGLKYVWLISRYDKCSQVYIPMHSAHWDLDAQ